MNTIYNTLYGYQNTQCLYLATKLKIADLLTTGRLHIDDIAHKVKVDPHKLNRVMRYLSAQSIFNHEADEYYSNNENSELLISTKQGSSYYYIIFICEMMYPAAECLLPALQNNEIPFEKNYGKEIWSFLKENQYFAELFNNAMQQGSYLNLPKIIASYDFSDYQSIIDVGGGKGYLVNEICKLNPTSQGIVYDLPFVIEQAKSQASDFSKNVDFKPGDFFKSVPSGADMYLLKVILHDWNDAEALTILQNCRKAMKPDAKLLIIEKVLMTSNDELTKLHGDINMLVTVSGRERTLVEFENLLQQADLRVEQLIETGTDFSIIEVNLMSRT